MKTIWKFPVQPDCIVDMPEGAKILSAGTQGEAIFVWAELNPNEEKKEGRHIVGFGTGHPMPDNQNRVFISTVFLGPFVFHIYEVLKD